MPSPYNLCIMVFFKYIPHATYDIRCVCEACQALSQGAPKLSQGAPRLFQGAPKVFQSALKLRCLLKWGPGLRFDKYEVSHFKIGDHVRRS